MQLLYFGCKEQVTCTPEAERRRGKRCQNYSCQVAADAETHPHKRDAEQQADSDIEHTVYAVRYKSLNTLQRTAENRRHTAERHHDHGGQYVAGLLDLQNIGDDTGQRRTCSEHHTSQQHTGTQHFVHKAADQFRFADSLILGRVSSYQRRDDPRRHTDNNRQRQQRVDGAVICRGKQVSHYDLI